MKGCYPLKNVHLSHSYFHPDAELGSFQDPKNGGKLVLASWLGRVVRVSALRVQSVFVWSVSVFPCLGGPCTSLWGRVKAFLESGIYDCETTSDGGSQAWVVMPKRLLAFRMLVTITIAFLACCSLLPTFCQCPNSP